MTDGTPFFVFGDASGYPPRLYPTQRPHVCGGSLGIELLGSLADRLAQ